METLYSRSIDLINHLPKNKINEAFNYLSYLKDKEEWEATYELISPEILKEIKNGIEEINSGKYIDFNDIRRNV